jgi:hypothetical protein
MFSSCQNEINFLAFGQEILHFLAHILTWVHHFSRMSTLRSKSCRCHISIVGCFSLDQQQHYQNCTCWDEIAEAYLTPNNRGKYAKVWSGRSKELREATASRALWNCNKCLNAPLTAPFTMSTQSQGHYNYFTPVTTLHKTYQIATRVPSCHSLRPMTLPRPSAPATSMPMLSSLDH